MVCPYQDACKLYKKSVEGEVYKKLLNQEYEIFENQNDVLEKFDALLNQNDVIQLATKQAEFLALQNQINPHFLYNTLEAIRGDALSAGIESIADTTEALATFFRYTITETENLVTLEDELSNVDDYFKIQQYRFGEKLSMELIFPKDGKEILELKLPKLTLQPIIENAIYHGLESRTAGGKVTIAVETTKQNLLLNIVDNGKGIEMERLKKLNQKLKTFSVRQESDDKIGGGIALMNVCRRIKLLFGEDYGIYIYSMVGIGTEVGVTIPQIS